MLLDEYDYETDIEVQSPAGRVRPSGGKPARSALALCWGLP